MANETTTAQATTEAATETKTEATTATTDAKATAATTETKETKAVATETKDGATETTTEQKTAAPEKYDLKLPEGSLLKPDHIEKIAAFAKERRLSNDVAQALLERDSQAAAGALEAQKAQLAEHATNWLNQAKVDQEIGGEAFTKNAEQASRVIQRFATPELKKVLNDTGLGNHPELVRMCKRIADVMSEDQLVIPNTQAGGKKSLEDVFYGTSDAKTT